MSLYDLLPPNATQFERDTSRAISSLPKLQGGPPLIRTAKRLNIPPSVLPWLVYEYGLGEVSRYFDDLNQLLVEGVAWQRIRGTPASILQSLSWLGLGGLVDESEAGSFRWSEYQIGLPEAVSDDTTRDVIYLAGLSTPVRSRLNRVFAVYDERRFVLDDSALSGGSMLSDHSGTRPAWAGGVQISYGRIHGDDVVAELSVGAGRERERFQSVVLIDRFILDHSIIGGTVDEDAWHAPNPPMGLERERFEETSATAAAREWTGAWDATTWTQPVATIVGGHMSP
jgi:P2-related tail formation protein